MNFQCAAIVNSVKPEISLLVCFMAFVLDPLYIVNLTLCIIILVLGFFGYRKTGNPAPLYIGIAFGLFGISHLATILGLKADLEAALIIIRTAAYLLVIFALYTILKKRLS